MEDKYKTPISDVDIYQKTPNSNKTQVDMDKICQCHHKKTRRSLNKERKETVSTSKEADE